MPVYSFALWTIWIHLVARWESFILKIIEILLPPASGGWGRYCFHRCVFVSAEYPMVSGPIPLPWSLVPCPFWCGGGGYLSPVTGPVQSHVLVSARGYPNLRMPLAFTLGDFPVWKRFPLKWFYFTCITCKPAPVTRITYITININQSPTLLEWINNKIYRVIYGSMCRIGRNVQKCLEINVVQELTTSLISHQDHPEAGPPPWPYQVTFELRSFDPQKVYLYGIQDWWILGSRDC